VEYAGPVTVRLALVTALVPAPALADHPGGAMRVEGMSPLMSAVLTGGLAFLVALVVVAVILVLTRKRPDSE
jgi:hypothetical protein